MKKKEEVEQKNLLTSLDKICKSIRQSYGKESINYLGNKEVEQIPRLSSGDFNLDAALGGGWPVGRIIELFGPESSGKSTLCYHAIAEAQKKWPDVPVALIDIEYAFDPVYAKSLGVNVESLLISQPDNGTDALNILVELIKHDVKLIVVDSVAALLPKEEDDVGLDQNQMGVQARLMSKALRKVTQAIGKHKSLVMFTNQIRNKIGVLYGNPETTPGGNALKFYASIRVRLSVTGKTNEGGEVVSTKVKASVVKNKTAAPFKTADIIIRFGKGIDKLESLINIAIEKNIIEQRGSWFFLFGEQIGQGRQVIRETLENNCELLQQLEEEIFSPIEIMVEEGKNDEDKQVDKETVTVEEV